LAARYIKKTTQSIGMWPLRSLITSVPGHFGPLKNDVTRDRSRSNSIDRSIDQSISNFYSGQSSSCCHRYTTTKSVVVTQLGNSYSTIRLGLLEQITGTVYICP